MLMKLCTLFGTDVHISRFKPDSLALSQIVCVNHVIGPSESSLTRSLATSLRRTLPASLPYQKKIKLKALNAAEMRLQACTGRLQELQSMFDNQMAEKKRIEDGAMALQRKMNQVWPSVLLVFE